MAYGLRGLIPDCLTRGGLGDIGLHNHHRGYGSRRYLPYDYDIEVSPFARKRTCLGCLEREAAIREHIEAENCLHEEPIYGCDNPSYGYFYEDPRCGRGYPDYRRRYSNEFLRYGRGYGYEGLLGGSPLSGGIRNRLNPLMNQRRGLAGGLAGGLSFAGLPRRRPRMGIMPNLSGTGFR